MEDTGTSIVLELASITEAEFAQAELRLGRELHEHNGVWWVKSAPYYCKPVHEFRPFKRGSVRPAFRRSWLGYSHQLESDHRASRLLTWNILQGQNLRQFSLTLIGQKKRNQVRQSLKQCTVLPIPDVAPWLDAMRHINIAQAQRFDALGDRKAYLPAEYYQTQEAQWRQDMLKIFSHPGHTLIGVFVDQALAAYMDLVRIEDTWMFGAVKSADEYLAFRPVDALYFSVLSLAAQSDCQRVVNGGGQEREGLVHFKRQFLFQAVSLPYFTWSLLPIERLKRLRQFMLRRSSSTAHTYILDCQLP
ncbi:MAG: hypothetical protein KF752_20240 [Pirellulaceae bacterium]|nr:hypothetical protein [Pirellulaceae bacterium]